MSLVIIAHMFDCLKIVGNARCQYFSSKIPVASVFFFASGSGPKIICKLGSGSVINSWSGFESGSKSSSVSNSQMQSCKNVGTVLKNCFFAMFRWSAVKIIFSKQSEYNNVQMLKNFLRYLDDLQFKCIFHKQSGSGPKLRSKLDPDPKKISSDPQHCR